MISIKWVITNKGTEEHPIAKARLVAREFNTGDKRFEIFAGTPGLMAMRAVISLAMTKPSYTVMQGGRCTWSCHRKIP